MTPEEFREAYLDAQNGLGNHLQTLSSLARTFADLAIRFDHLASVIQTDYSRMNEVVEQFISEQEAQLEQQPPDE